MTNDHLMSEGGIVSASMIPSTPAPRTLAIGFGLRDVIVDLVVRLLDALATAEPPALPAARPDSRDPGVVTHHRP